MAAQYRVVVLTEAQFRELQSIIGNGWGEGDYAEVYPKTARTAEMAMDRFDRAGKLSADALRALRATFTV